jgi:hypothetical protein
MGVDKIREYIKIVEASGIDELEITTGGENGFEFVKRQRRRRFLLLPRPIPCL